MSVEGLKYQGEWKEDQKVGRGVATFKTDDGKVQVTVKSNDRTLLLNRRISIRMDDWMLIVDIHSDWLIFQQQEYFGK